MLRHERQTVAMALAERQQSGAGRSATATDDESQRGRGPRGAPRPTGTDATSPGDAAGPRNSCRKSLHARPQCFKHHRRWWSILPPRPQCSKLFRQWWSILHPRLLSKRQRLSWSFFHPRQQCPDRKRQVWSSSHLRQLFFVLEVFKALSQDRVPPLVVDMIFLSLLGGDALRMRVPVCTIGMWTRWTLLARDQGP